MEEMNIELQPEENQEIVLPETPETPEVPEAPETEPHDKNVKLMSPTMMVVRRFFRSKLSIVGLIMVVGLFLFSFLGPVVYNRWGEIELDRSGKLDYAASNVTFTADNGETYELVQVAETEKQDNFLSGVSKEHPLGTDQQGYDVLVRLMYGGRISLTVSFIAVFLITVLGVVLGGLAGYFGGWVDSLIMRLSDVLGSS